MTMCKPTLVTTGRTQQATMMGVVGRQCCVRLHGAKQKAKHLIA